MCATKKMKILLVIATVLIISVSLFLLALDKDYKAKNKKREEIFNTPFKLQKVTKAVSFADDVRHDTTKSSLLNKQPVCSVLIDEDGATQLLNMNAFLEKYYSDQMITDCRTLYESEALSIRDRYKKEEFIWKKESERFHF